MDSLDVTDLSRDYGGTHAVEGLSFRVARGEIFGLVGPTGSGKTTTLRMLATLLRPTRGTATVLGHDLRRAPHRIRPLLGLMLQEPALDAEISAADNLRFYLGLRGVRGSEAAGRVGEALAALDLEALRGQPVGEMSWGMKRRVEVARVLCGQPQVLLLDEPTLGLDARMRERVVRALSAYRGGGAIVFVCTHDPEMMEACDRVALLKAGRLIAVDAPQALRERFPRGPLRLTPARPTDENAAAILERLAALGLDAVSRNDEVEVGSDAVDRWLPGLLQEFGARIDGVSYAPPRLRDTVARLLEDG